MLLTAKYTLGALNNEQRCILFSLIDRPIMIKVKLIFVNIPSNSDKSQVDIVLQINAISNGFLIQGLIWTMLREQQAYRNKWLDCISLHHTITKENGQKIYLIWVQSSKPLRIVWSQYTRQFQRILGISSQLICQPYHNGFQHIQYPFGWSWSWI